MESQSFNVLLNLYEESKVFNLRIYSILRMILMKDPTSFSGSSFWCFKLKIKIGVINFWILLFRSKYIKIKESQLSNYLLQRNTPAFSWKLYFFFSVKLESSCFSSILTLFLAFLWFENLLLCYCVHLNIQNILYFQQNKQVFVPLEEKSKQCLIK